MNRALFICLVFILLLFCLSDSFAATMSVQVRETQVRGTPSFLGKIIAVLSYGDQVEIVEEAKGWFKITVPATGDAGWVSGSALSEKRIVLKSGAGDVSSTASSSEVALAGKGFNEQVEAQYRSDTNLDYAWIDRMEDIAYPPDELIAFLAEGELRGAE
jgi:hypothetical protein